MSTKAQTIEKFHLYMDDTTELSSTEEEALYDKILNQIYNDRPWEFLKKAGTGTITLANDVYYVTLPSDFAYFTPNHNWSDDSYLAHGPVVFVGTNYSPYQIVSFSDRRQYRTTTGKAYLDFANLRLVFTGTPNVGDSVEFDYIYRPTALTNGQSPVFPSDYHDIIYHGMCTDEFIIEQSDKAKSYRKENMDRYDDYLRTMAQWNANLIQMGT